MSNLLAFSSAEPALALADGAIWIVSAHNLAASPIVSAVRKVMQFRSFRGVPSHRLVVIAGDDLPGPSDERALPGRDETAGTTTPTTAQQRPLARNNSTSCHVLATTDPDLFTVQMMRVAAAVAQQSELGGGVLLHGGLAEFCGQGVILAGPGGAGKTTASRRLPAPWRSHSDDATLVVRDRQGIYWAHPWPTWSRFLWGGPGGSWDVQHTVPLRGIFFLGRSEEDAVERIGPGRAATLLATLAEQANSQLSWGMAREAARAARLKRFDSVCALARAIPAYVLRLSLRGAFWRQLEQVLG